MQPALANSLVLFYGSLRHFSIDLQLFLPTVQPWNPVATAKAHSLRPDEVAEHKLQTNTIVGNTYRGA